MANPNVWPHIQVYPEDADDILKNANQGRRWLYELDADLLTPVFWCGDQDFYSFEPAILDDGTVVVPYHWFKYHGEMYAMAWLALRGSIDSVHGWFVHQYKTVRIAGSRFSVSFPYFCDSFEYRSLPNPRNILGEWGQYFLSVF